MRQNLTYILFTAVLIALSAFGVNYLYFRPIITTNSVPTSAPTISIKPTIAVIPTTSTLQSFSSNIDKFSFTYGSSRKLYQDKEPSGNRYTLYSPSGNIAIHVGKIWSWTNPKRVFTSTILVDNQPTFVFDIANQVITDFQHDGLNFTIQCVHNGNTNIKSECQQLLKDFKFTKI